MAENFSTRVAAVASGTDKTAINLFNPAATPTTRARIYEISVGSQDTPADEALDLLLNRTTAVGTEGSGLTPHNLGGGPAGAYDSGLGAFSGEPTYTAGAILHAWQQNLRTSFLWRAFPGKEPILAATQNNGAGLKTASATGTSDYGTTILFQE